MNLLVYRVPTGYLFLNERAKPSSEYPPSELVFRLDTSLLREWVGSMLESAIHDHGKLMLREGSADSLLAECRGCAGSKEQLVGAFHFP